MRGTSLSILITFPTKGTPGGMGIGVVIGANCEVLQWRIHSSNLGIYSHALVGLFVEFVHLRAVGYQSAIPTTAGLLFMDRGPKPRY